MKTWVKILLIFLTVAIFWGIVFVTMFMAKEDNVRNYSTYCMDKIRWEVSEYIWNVYRILAVNKDMPELYS